MKKDDRTLAERIIKTELTKKADEYHLLKLCSDVAKDKQHPKSAEANKLVDGWRKLQSLPESSPKEQQAKKAKLEALVKRMAKFRNESQ